MTDQKKTELVPRTAGPLSTSPSEIETRHRRHMQWACLGMIGAAAAALLFLRPELVVPLFEIAVRALWRPPS